MSTERSHSIRPLRWRFCSDVGRSEPHSVLLCGPSLRCSFDAPLKQSIRYGPPTAVYPSWFEGLGCTGEYICVRCFGRSQNNVQNIGQADEASRAPANVNVVDCKYLECLEIDACHLGKSMVSGRRATGKGEFYWKGHLWFSVRSFLQCKAYTMVM